MTRTVGHTFRLNQTSRASRLRLRWPLSLFWRVFGLNALLLTVAVFCLAVSPVTVSFPVTLGQVAVLTAGLCVVLAANAFLLRVSLRPLQEMAKLMRNVDLLVPGARLTPAGAAELRTVASTFNQMLGRLEHERRQSSTRTLGRVERERRRLANELHDEVGQGLTALLLQLRSMLEDAPAELRPELAESQEIARSTLDEVRRIARHLRPTTLDDLGLGYSLQSLVDVVGRTSGLKFECDIETDLPPLADDGKLALFRIAQESLTNVMRHADAAVVRVVLRQSKAAVYLEVKDDGRGMLYDASVDSGGIRGMRERALAVGGTLDIDSRPTRGTAVVAQVPVRNG